MQIADQSTVRNRLLALMAKEDFERLAPHMSFADAPKGAVILEPGEPIEEVVFLENGIGSIVAATPEGLQAEGGLFGRDGASPIDLVLGADRTPNRIFMQVAGEGWRVPAAVLTAAARDSEALRTLLLRYAQTLTLQATYTALSNAVHPIDERLARWLLMCDDRSDTGELALTHEFISIMLAVRRPSVTTSLHVLEGNRFIRTERSRIVIHDRHALEAFAGDAYGKPEAEYERLIGPLRAPPV